jgi:hypothetical protein
MTHYRIAALLRDAQQHTSSQTVRLWLEDAAWCVEDGGNPHFALDCALALTRSAQVVAACTAALEFLGTQHGNAKRDAGL